jgi:hypothetical protein
MDSPRTTRAASSLSRKEGRGVKVRVRAARRATAEAHTGDGLGWVKSQGREKGPR